MAVIMVAVMFFLVMLAVFVAAIVTALVMRVLLFVFAHIRCSKEDLERHLVKCRPIAPATDVNILPAKPKNTNTFYDHINYVTT
ncbi:exported hypothetical protein [Paraburkholderia ribeironis]|uniref:Uncharacterized protein n=1 Tax=Paraburkholderia ribeironis TaxID=1247936 RepID=A0A1N7SPS5_9BURK|nr:hypothetical protein [Paraburkholderia ribeironis]SIT49342.1 exported hypothetical protein [Paraburkholderia ribeironis]